MKYEAILFDLDGTLLPMDFDEFLRGYFGLLTKAVAPLGYEQDHMISSMWKGVSAMTKNEGPRKNSELFWDIFSEWENHPAREHILSFDAFYETEFHKAKALTQPTPKAKEAVAAARDAAEYVVLATNPIFPEVAVKARLSWADLRLEDFDLVTHYDNCTASKPNPLYFENIAKTLGIDPKKSLMIGNNVEEDILPSQKAGFSAFLLTDCLMSQSDTLPDCPHGSWEELLAFLK